MDEITAAPLSDKDAEIKALKDRLAKLESPVVTATVAEAKAATEYNLKTGWPMPTAEDEAYATAHGTKAAVIIKGKVVARIRTPRIIALERIARGEAPLPPIEFETAPPDPGAERRAGPKGRKVLILNIGPEHDGILKLNEDSDFESAAEAARLLDVSHAFISQEFKKAAGKPITIRGVTMQYEDIYIEDDSNFRD